MGNATRVSLKCAECGLAFELLECQTKNGRGRFCSKECRDTSRRHGSELNCAMCDTTFYRRHGEQGDSLNQFCSKRCYSEWRLLESSTETYKKTGTRHIHRVVAEAVMGRPLEQGEVIHHIDHNKENNHPSNLALFSSQALHAKFHRPGSEAMSIEPFKISRSL